MDELIKTTPHYVRIAPGGALPDVTPFAPFKAIVVLESEYSSDWQNEVSNWLVASGCRYMMAWGPECSSWDDSVDWADIEARDYKEDDSKFVMTTWHDDESLESVFWYSQFCAIFSCDEQELRKALILHVSESDREAEFLLLFEQSRTLAEREPD
jgi:hypothetical protein